MSIAQETHARLKGVTKVFPAQPGMEPVEAVGPIEFDIRRGEFFAIVGPSGCGKSTLLDILAGLTPPTTGEVSFEGKLVQDEVPDGVGVVFQEDASFPWLTVWNNVAFGLRRQGIERAEIEQRVNHALQFMGLTDFAKAHPAQLSGGMRQRVCIAELLRLWRSTGATVVLITHAIDEACMLADRVGIMTARPGRFADVIATDWTPDRDSRVVSHERFGKLTGHVWSILREESLRAIGHTQRVGQGGSL